VLKEVPAHLACVIARAALPGVEEGMAVQFAEALAGQAEGERSGGREEATAGQPVHSAEPTPAFRPCPQEQATATPETPKGEFTGGRGDRAQTAARRQGGAASGEAANATGGEGPGQSGRAANNRPVEEPSCQEPVGEGDESMAGNAVNHFRHGRGFQELIVQDVPAAQVAGQQEEARNGSRQAAGLPGHARDRASAEGKGRQRPPSGVGIMAWLLRRWAPSANGG
jgi:hypothetical protein